MTVAVVLAMLALLDALLCGFRGAAGREGRIRKRAYFRCALARAALGALGLIAVNGSVVAILVLSASEPAAAWDEIVLAGELCCWIFGGFAALVLAALAFWFSPVAELRLLSSIIVLGPVTLLRPVVILGGLAAACVTVPDPRAVAAAIIAGASVLSFEPLVSRRYARRWQRLMADQQCASAQGTHNANPSAL